MLSPKGTCLAMYTKGQIWEWHGKSYIVDEVWTYKVHQEWRTIGKIREMKEDGFCLLTTDINFIKESEYLTFIGTIPLETYYKKVTESWHKTSSNIKGYVVCSMEEATHVVFSEEGIQLAKEDSKGFTPNKVYPVQIEEESGDFIIIDDHDQVTIGFDLFIPCEYLKKEGTSEDALLRKKQRELPENVISIFGYQNRKKD